MHFPSPLFPFSIPPTGRSINVLAMCMTGQTPNEVSREAAFDLTRAAQNEEGEKDLKRIRILCSTSIAYL